MSKSNPGKESDMSVSTLSSQIKLQHVLDDVRACRMCEHVLEPNPVVRAAVEAELLIVGQAPGSKVHATGIPWNDPSGDRLRQWLAMDRETFYDQTKVAIIPMGFCYPGKGKSGDLPPRPECAEQWHPSLMELLPNIKLTLLVGSYAQAYYLGQAKKKTLTETVRNFQEYLDQGVLPMPHPSPRNTLWLKKNPWFEQEVVPVLREQLRHFV